MQCEGCKLPSDVRRSDPYLHLWSMGDCDILTVGGECDGGDGAFEGDVVEDCAFTDVDEERTAI